MCLRCFVNFSRWPTSNISIISACIENCTRFPEITILTPTLNNAVHGNLWISVLNHELLDYRFDGILYWGIYLQIFNVAWFKSDLYLNCSAKNCIILMWDKKNCFWQHLHLEEIDQKKKKQKLSQITRLVNYCKFISEICVLTVNQRKSTKVWAVTPFTTKLTKTNCKLYDLIKYLKRSNIRQSDGILEIL